MILMNIKIVTNEEEAKKADELLTKLIHFESDFNKNINPNYIVHNHLDFIDTLVHNVYLMQHSNILEKIFAKWSAAKFLIAI